MGTRTAKGSELASLTVSMLLSLVFSLVVLWTFPFIPMAIAIMYGWPSTTILTLWLIGLPFSGTACFYLFKKGK